ncbi:unnamed protein product [Timema podura]|uniref:Uncharacterized protein n=1 Tax=Timema podura TaxID=61482 RepID=A0ABN7NXE4_TIMPD|nr:unnamed protein product [Timema podura]
MSGTSSVGHPDLALELVSSTTDVLCHNEIGGELAELLFATECETSVFYTCQRDGELSYRDQWPPVAEPLTKLCRSLCEESAMRTGFGSTRSIRRWETANQRMTPSDLQSVSARVRNRLRSFTSTLRVSQHQVAFTVHSQNGSVGNLDVFNASSQWSRTSIGRTRLKIRASHTLDDIMTLDSSVVKEGFGNQINLCRDRGLNPGPSAQKFDTLPLDHQPRYIRPGFETSLHITGKPDSTSPCTRRRKAVSNVRPYWVPKSDLEHKMETNNKSKFMVAPDLVNYK